MQRVGTSLNSQIALGTLSQRLGDKRCPTVPHSAFLGVTTSFQASRIERKRRDPVQIQSALFDPPPFDPAKLDISYLPGTSSSDSSVPHRRRYTLTHNDLTGTLQLSIGLDYNADQVSGWYTRIVRDEVLAEWAPPPAGASKLSTPLALNVYCHVSGEELWPAPPALRSFIFQREMRLVLDTIAYAERATIAAHPSLANATVFLHLVSDLESLNKVVAWGSLGIRTSWQKAGLGRGLFNEVLSGMEGVMSLPSLDLAMTDDDDDDDEGGVGGDNSSSGGSSGIEGVFIESSSLPSPPPPPPHIDAVESSLPATAAATAAASLVEMKGGTPGNDDGRVEIEQRRISTPSSSSSSSRSRGAVPASTAAAAAVRLSRSPLGAASPSSSPPPPSSSSHSGNGRSSHMAVAAQRGDSMWTTEVVAESSEK